MNTDLWRIEPQDADGEHVDGTRWDSALGRWIEDDDDEVCSYCEAHRNDPMMPPHKASDHCESGKHNHCTCDTCY